MGTIGEGEIGRKTGFYPPTIASRLTVIFPKKGERKEDTLHLIGARRRKDPKLWVRNLKALAHLPQDLSGRT